MARADYTQGTLTVSADWTDAASPITYRTDGGEDRPTVFQVADARHDAARAWRLVTDWLDGDAG